MKCMECGKALRITHPKTYAYRESGLDTVLLTGIRVYVCPSCGAEFPEISNIIGLHQVIASHLTRKPAPLTGPEFRFLRKEISLKAKELAQCLGVTDVSLSRWENGASPISPAADRLLRTLYSLKTMQAGRAIEPQKFITAFLEDFKRIVPGKPSRPMDITIPADRVAAVPA
jgi:putative zinc finger/helix-turn-helix YgiT family protein